MLFTSFCNTLLVWETFVVFNLNHVWHGVWICLFQTIDLRCSVAVHWALVLSLLPTVSRRYWISGLTWITANSHSDWRRWSKCFIEIGLWSLLPPNTELHWKDYNSHIIGLMCFYPTLPGQATCRTHTQVISNNYVFLVGHKYSSLWDINHLGVVNRLCWESTTCCQGVAWTPPTSAECQMFLRRRLTSDRWYFYHLGTTSIWLAWAVDIYLNRTFHDAIVGA